jgi:HdeA/HdeB family protein
MHRIRIAGLAPLLTLALALTANATMNKADATRITCGDFASQSADYQRRVLAFLQGYAHKDAPETSLGNLPVRADTARLTEACARDPESTVLQKVEESSDNRDSGTAQKHPGMNEVRPTRVTCEQYERLDRETQLELVYWLEGYSRSTHGGSSVDLDRDVSSAATVCHSTPHQTLRSALRPPKRSDRESGPTSQVPRPLFVAQAGGGAGGMGGNPAGSGSTTNPAGPGTGTTAPGPMGNPGGVGPNGETIDPNRVGPSNPTDPNLAPEEDPNLVPPDVQRRPGALGDEPNEMDPALDPNRGMPLH